MTQLATGMEGKLPTMEDLVTLADTDQAYANSALAVLLNQEPPKKWVKSHPIAKVERVDASGNKTKVPLPYIPVERVEYLLTRIFTKWWVEIKDTKQVANAIMVTVRLYVIDPLSGETRWNDGVGAVAIQTDKGANASDWSQIKANGVQLAAPAAESYAFKDAAEKFGRIFGKDISRQEQINYADLLTKKEEVTLEMLEELYNLKQESCTEDEKNNIERIIKNKETKSYAKIYNKLKSK